MSWIRRHGYFLAFYGLLFVALLWPLLLMKKSFLGGDYGAQYYPWSYCLSEALKNAHLPYWTSQMASGFPLMAEGQVAGYYLINLLSYAILPFRWAYTYAIPFHILLGGIGFYRLNLQWNLSRQAAALGAIVFSFSSAYGGCFYTTATLKVLAWLPWVILLIDLMSQAKKVSLTTFWSLLLAMVFSQMWTAGFPQMAFYAAVYGALWVVLRHARCMNTVVGYVLAACLGILLGLPQIILTGELAVFSARQGAGVDFALWGSAMPPSVLSLLFPEWGFLFRSSVYLGVLPFFLALIALTFKKNPLVRAHLILGLFFLFLALGKYNPIYAYFIKVAGLTYFRVPLKFLFFFSVSMAALAAIAWDRLIKESLEPVERLWARRLCAGLVVAMLCLPAFAYFSFKAVEKPFVERIHAYTDKVFKAKADPMKKNEEYHQLINQMIGAVKKITHPTNPRNLHAMLLGILSALILWRMLQPSYNRGMVIWAMTLVCVDLFYFGITLGTGFIGNAQPFEQKKRDSAALMIKNLDGPRDTPVAEWSADRTQEIFEPNSNMIYGISSVGGYSPLLIKKYYELTKDLGLSDASLGRHAVSQKTWSEQRGVLDAVGGGLIIADQKLGFDGMTQAAESSSRYVYRNAQALTRAHLVYGFKVIEDPIRRLTYLKSPEFKPLNEAVLDKSPGFPGLSLDLPGIPAEIVSRSDESWELRVSAEQDAILVLQNVFYPGWKASVNGVDVPLICVNHALTGIPIKKGAHEIRYYYDLRRIHRFEALSIFLWGVLIFLSVMLWKRNRSLR